MLIRRNWVMCLIRLRSSVKFLLVDFDPLVLESSMGCGQILYLPEDIEPEAAARLTSSSKLVEY